MKQIILPTLLLLLFSYVSQAKSFTVSNRPGSPAQYTIIADAIAAASAGDTIYILGSENKYERISLSKRLVFIGPGHNPPKQTPLKVYSEGITVDANGSGSTFIGLSLSFISAPGSHSSGIHNITVKRCSITSGISVSGPTTGWIIENNIIGSIIIGSINGGSSITPNNYTISNNIISGGVYSGIYNLNTGLIRNNIFIQPSSQKRTSFTDVKNSNIINNIFYSVSPEGAENSIFTSNISYSNKATAIPYGTNSGLNNKIDVDPKFTNFPAEGDVFKYEYDFRLQASSPGKNAGTDGKDIGIYGGTGFSETGEPPVPHVREFAIINGVVAPNGKLSISIKAEAKN